MYKYELVVFDMAGTTVNEDNLVYKTLTKSLNKFGYDIHLKEVLLHGAGMEKLEAIKNILALDPSGTKDIDPESVYADFIVALEDSYNTVEVSAYKEALPVIGLLRNHGVKVVLNTGYDRKTANQLLERIQWEEGVDFDLLVTADQVNKSRPHADMILLAMEMLNITDNSKVVKVGDSAIDIEEGKNSGCGLTIGITTGAQTSEQLRAASPDHIVNSLGKIPDLLLM